MHEKHTCLSVMLFKAEEGDQTEKMIDFMIKLQARYPQHNLTLQELPGSFSRGEGLKRGSENYSNNALLVFMDVDMIFNRAFILRAKMNTIQYKQAYFPVVFSQFDPDTHCNDHPTLSPLQCRQSLINNPYQYSEDVGYWRNFGFGIVAIYKSDFLYAGGFGKDRKSWGLEDVDLYESLLRHNLTVLRAPEPGLIHIYHVIDCDPNAPIENYQSCLGTSSATYGAHPRLAAMVLNDEKLLNKVVPYVPDPGKP